MACKNCGTSLCDCDDVFIPLGEKGDPGESVIGPQGPPGDQGTAGVDGSKWVVQVGPPLAPLDAPSGFSLNSSNGEIYSWNGSAWNSTGQFLLGPAGTDGTDGAPGSRWYVGTVAPNFGPITDPAFYLNVTNGDVYSWDGSNPPWALEGNIRGPQGLQGLQGIPGTNGSTGPAGARGSKIFTGTSDPNTLNLSPFEDGDAYWRFTGSGIEIYQFSEPPGIFNLVGTLSCCGGGTTPATSFMFRAYKNADQPLLQNVADQVINFENDTSTPTPGYDNGNNWTMNMWVANADAAARTGGVKLILENAEVGRTAAGTPVSFSVFIKRYPVGGGPAVTLASVGPLLTSATPPYITSAGLLDTGFVAFTEGDIVRVTITTGSTGPVACMGTCNIYTV